MADTIVNDVPPDATQLNAQGQPVQVSLRPVQFNAASLWESPCFWIVIGSGLTLLAIYVLKRKG